MFNVTACLGTKLGVGVMRTMRHADKCSIKVGMHCKLNSGLFNRV